MDCKKRFSTFRAFKLFLWEIIVHVSTSKFTAQTLSLSYLNGDFVRWCGSYEIRILLEQSYSQKCFKRFNLTFSLNRLVFSHMISNMFRYLTKETEKYENESNFIGNLDRLLFIYTSPPKRWNFEACVEHLGPFKSSWAYACRRDLIPNHIIWVC